MSVCYVCLLIYIYYQIPSNYFETHVLRKLSPHYIQHTNFRCRNHFENMCLGYFQRAAILENVKSKNTT